MIQCSDCEFCECDEDGELTFACDPFLNIKEPECLIKWQLLKLDTLLHHHEQMAEMHERLAPMQEKLFNYMEREIQEQKDADSWKEELDEDENEDGLSSSC